MGWIYLIRNNVNGKCYVGQTRQKKVESRWSQERRAPHGILANAFKFYGIDNFTFEALYELPNDELNEREVFEIQFRNTLSPNGYNLKPGGENHEVHPDVRKKIGDSMRGEKHWNFGKKASDETRKRLSISHKGQKQSKESIMARAKSNTGKKRTEEFRKKVSGENNWNFGKTGTLSPNFGKKHTEEVKCKIGDSHRGEKSVNYGKFGEDANASKKVDQFTLDGKFIKTYVSLVSAASDIGLVRTSGISSCCHGKQKTAGGFIWKWFQHLS